jgi:predicted hotdog family 3-hydroxylacyl-ACP dehydratase
MSLPLYSILSVLPQAPPMALIDEMLEREAGRLAAGVTVRADSLFFQPGRGIPAHVSLEWMAQVCAAYAGAEALDEKRPVKVGFILGTRDFRARRAWFAEGERFRLETLLIYHDGEVANFSCSVGDPEGGSPLVEAGLTVFHPHDASAVIAAQS